MTDRETVLVPLAPGFEEIEAVTIIDVLRRAEVHVVVAGLSDGPVWGAHGLEITADATLDSIVADELRMIVLPGGMPGTTHLMEDPRVLELVRALHANGRTTAAICAAPLVLAAAGVVDGVQVTAHPSVHEQLGTARVETASRVVRAGSVLTSQGPGTALEFALAIVEELRGPEKAAELARAMIVTPSEQPV
jgi:4-methyl-5(b-hydroxyethyl)-thiazole monophosphate biosynthesis